MWAGACLGHDTNGSAPYDRAHFPTTANGISTGKDLSDYLFLKDMLAEAENVINKKMVEI